MARSHKAERAVARDLIRNVRDANVETIRMHVKLCSGEEGSVALAWVKAGATHSGVQAGLCRRKSRGQVGAGGLGILNFLCSNLANSNTAFRSVIGGPDHFKQLGVLVFECSLVQASRLHGNDVTTLQSNARVKTTARSTDVAHENAFVEGLTGAIDAANFRGIIC